MRRRRIGGMVAVLGLAVLGLGAPAAVAGGGNSDAAHACQQDGYLDLHRADGTGFANAGACVSYAAKGGEFQTPLPSCTVDVDNNVGCVTFTNATMPFFSGGLGDSTITVNAVFSFDGSQRSLFPGVEFALPNEYATGGGTYVIKSADGTVIDEGALTADGAAGQGLVRAFYGSAEACHLATNRTLQVAASADGAAGVVSLAAQETLTSGSVAGAISSGYSTTWLANPTSAVTIDC